MDKSEWQDGPWQHEPDGGAWVTKSGMLGAYVRHPEMGTLNGYVAIPPEHPLYGKDYEEVNLEAHGGITFSGQLTGTLYVELVTKDVGAGLWWFGFDTAHYDDFIPALRKLVNPRSYKDLAYVQREVEHLAAQLSGYATATSTTPARTAAQPADAPPG